MSFIFIVVLKAQKPLTPKDVAAVKGLMAMVSLSLKEIPSSQPMIYKKINLHISAQQTIKEK
jgi:hypothetical protein